MTEDVLWADLLSIANILFFGLIAIYSLLQSLHETGFMRLMMAILGLVGAYWAALYLLILVMPQGTFDPIWFGRIAVRPAFTFTGAAMACMALWRWRAGCKK